MHLLTHAAAVDAGLLAAGALMVLTGIRSRLVSFKARKCRVCHHTRAACTCRWR